MQVLYRRCVLYCTRSCVPSGMARRKSGVLRGHVGPISRNVGADTPTRASHRTTAHTLDMASEMQKGTFAVKVGLAQVLIARRSRRVACGRGVSDAAARRAEKSRGRGVPRTACNRVFLPRRVGISPRSRASRPPSRLAAAALELAVASGTRIRRAVARAHVARAPARGDPSASRRRAFSES